MKPCSSFEAALAEAIRLTKLEKPPVVQNQEQEQEQEQDGGMKM